MTRGGKPKPNPRFRGYGHARLREPKERIMTREECAAWLASRPSGEKAEPRLEPPTPAGDPPRRGRERYF